MKRILFHSLSVLVGFVFIEICLHAVLYLLRSDSQNAPHSIKDSALGHRPNPDHPDHDKNGFRNENAPGTIDVLAMGDSQTYGLTVSSEQAWSAQLSELTDVNTYNMSMGGWGMTHLRMLFSEAIALSPEKIVVGFYSGNDLYDAFSHVYKQGQLEGMKSNDLVTRELIESLEATESYASLVSKVAGDAILPKPKSFILRLRYFLSNYSAIYYILGKIRRYLNKDRAWVSILQLAKENKFDYFDEGSVQAVFQSAYRLKALNFEDIRIREGLRISLECIKWMKEEAARHDINFYLLMIPTKEYAFNQEVLSREKVLSRDYSILVAHEETFMEQSKLFFKTHGITYIEAVQEMRILINKGRSPYAANVNGHPDEHGQRVIAEAVRKKLKL